MKDDLLWQAMQRIEIKAIEDKINAYIALAKKLDYPHVVIRMIIELEDELVMRANGVPSFKVKLGSHKGNLALQVVEPIGRR